MKPIWMFVDHLNPFCDTDDSGGGGTGEPGKDKTDDEGTKTDEPKTFTQDEVDRIVRTRLAREKDSIKTSVLQDLQRKQDEDVAAKRGEFDKVLAAKDEEIRKLTGLQTTIEEYETLANARYAEALKTLPETIRALAPDEDATPLEKDRWWTKKALPALERWEKEANTSTRRGPNDGRNPEPSKKDKEAYLNDLRQQMRATGQYNF